MLYLNYKCGLRTINNNYYLLFIKHCGSFRPTCFSSVCTFITANKMFDGKQGH